uniref:AlNc14C254G9701 protein n=1 Tax=Albugo laibachii Nc14 TaxID=890382 RepID=F0WTM4_9STRA|nr:AlNc14C254G9701 [Albugo laibachii Nc14]|eukprot:CCA24716.1 AlNc14C254G9701 [Albugo laibachii Nc14]
MTSYSSINLFTASSHSLMIFPSYLSLQLLFFPITMSAKSHRDAHCIHLTYAEDRTAIMSCLYANSIHSQMLAFNYNSALIRINFGNDASPKRIMKECPP